MLQEIISKIKKSWDDWWTEFEQLQLDEKMMIMHNLKGE